MNWNDLKCYLAVAREGQILGAARRLVTSQATVNRRIGELEQALGARLFERSTTGCALTEAGRNLLPHAERMESEALGISAALAPSDKTVAGTIRIGAPDGFGVSFLAPRLGMLLDRYPDLRVQLVPVPRVFSLSQREADLAITIGRPEKGRLLAKKLVDYSLGMYATKGYLEQCGAPHRVEDLKEHRLIGYVEDLIFTPQLDFNAQIAGDWRSSIEISSALGQLEAVRAGAGIGVLHRFMTVGDPDLVPVLPEIQLSREYWTVWHESLRNSRRVRAVVDFLDDIVDAERRQFRAAHSVP